MEADAKSYLLTMFLCNLQTLIGRGRPFVFLRQGRCARSHQFSSYCIYADIISGINDQNYLIVGVQPSSARSLLKKGQNYLTDGVRQTM